MEVVTNHVKNGKLVRDKIPQIIIEDGKTPLTRILDDEEYLKALMEFSEVKNKIKK